MLETALRARLPLITVTTNDPLSVRHILMYLTGKTNIGKGKKKVLFEDVTDDQVVFAVGDAKIPDDKSVEQVEGHYRAHGATLILVNPTKAVPPNFYDAGEMPVPERLVFKAAAKVVGDGNAMGLLPALGGLTLKEVAWLIQLASSETGEITRESLTRVRRTSFPTTSGLQQADTDLGPYMPDERLEAWAEFEMPFFMNGEDSRLRPRGLLFDGTPGCGKTLGAKWLAHQYGLPLYRLNTGGLLNKYVGETAKAMTQLLRQVDADQPCVLLLDEVEKLFGKNNTDGAGAASTNNVLGELLWWLQEHTSRVLTIMTTNGADRLPPELIRQGRIDQTMTFEGLNEDGVRHLATFLYASYNVGLTTKDKIADINEIVVAFTYETATPVGTIVSGIMRRAKLISHVAVDAAVKRKVKSRLLLAQKSKNSPCYVRNEDSLLHQAPS